MNNSMKQRLILMMFLLCALLPAIAQQQTGDLRSKSVFAFPEFKDAKVLQPFGRFVKAKANILLKNGALCFMQGDTVMQANTARVLGVKFDSLEYKKVDDTKMGEVIARKGYNLLLCVTTIDMERYNAETGGGDNADYLEIIDAGQLFEIDGKAFEYDKGYPLRRKYYFSIMGTIIPANESNFKKYVRPEMKTAFKRLMNDKFWSWNDAASLTQLFTYLPEK